MAGILQRTAIVQLFRTGQYQKSHLRILTCAQKKFVTGGCNQTRHYSPKWDNSGDDRFFILSNLEPFEALTDVTFPEIIWDKLPTREKLDAFKCAITGRKYTYGDLYKMSRSFATALRQSGLKKRDVVCIALPNIPEFPIVTLGIWQAGLVSSPINPTFTSFEYAKQMIDSNARAIVTIPLFVPTVLEAKKQCPQLKSVIVVGDPPESCHSFFQMSKVDTTGSEYMKSSDIDPTEELALIPYSSGTTGPPKGVLITHANYCTNIHQILHPSCNVSRHFEETGEQIRIVAMLPLFHAYGATVVMGGGMLHGAFVSCIPKFVPQVFVNTIKEHRPTILHAVEPLISFIVDCPDIRTKDFESTIAITAGGAPTGKSLVNKLFTKVHRPFLFQEGFGMTETTSVSNLTLADSNNSKIGSCGPVLPGTLSKIVDVETGEALGPNQKGEVCVKGPQIMKGYLNNDKATAETIDSDKWLHTGDIGLYDDQNYLHIVDRLKELIKVKGMQVAPSELEDILRGHPDVADVAVIGIPDKRWGELPRAYIVKHRDQLSEDMIHSFLENKIATHKKLKGGVEFVNAIPKALSGKILRRELKKKYMDNRKPS